MRRETNGSTMNIENDARNFDLELIIAAWEQLRAQIAAEDPTIKDPGHLAAEIVVSRIDEIVNRLSSPTGVSVASPEVRIRELMSPKTLAALTADRQASK